MALVLAPPRAFRHRIASSGLGSLRRSLLKWLNISSIGVIPGGPMRGRAFMDVARAMSRASTEAQWRTAAGRAYYGLLLEARDALQRWGFSCLRNDPLHAFVRLRFALP